MGQRGVVFHAVSLLFSGRISVLFLRLGDFVSGTHTFDGKCIQMVQMCFREGIHFDSQPKTWATEVFMHVLGIKIHLKFSLCLSR